MFQRILKTVRFSNANNRSALFQQYIQELPKPLTIIDLGGTGEMWKRWGITEKDGLHLTLVNNHHIDKTHQGETFYGSFIKTLQEDVLRLTPNFLATFDVVFSNSMMEHLESRDAQAQLANNITQSGRRHFIQVPNKRCLVDPHFPHPFAPFFALFPKPFQAYLLTLHPLGSGSRSKTYSESRRRIKYYNPIGQRDLNQLFPKAKIEVEWIMGLPMSLVATRQDIS